MSTHATIRTSASARTSRSDLNIAMCLLAAQPRSLFVGQNVCYSGTAMYKDLEGIPASQRIEFPIAEDLNVGFATGLALLGYLPVVVIPRIDFLLRAADQLVNHLDKIPVMSCGQWNPKVIIRTRVGSKTPLDAGPQHTNDLSGPFAAMLSHVKVFKITRPSQIIPTYTEVIETPFPSIVVEAL